MPIIYNVLELFSIFAKSVTSLQSKMEINGCTRRKLVLLPLSGHLLLSLPHLPSLYPEYNKTISNVFKNTYIYSSVLVILFYTKPNVKSASSKSHKTYKGHGPKHIELDIVRFGVLFSAQTLLFFKIIS